MINIFQGRRKTWGNLFTITCIETAFSCFEWSVLTLESYSQLTWWKPCGRSTTKSKTMQVFRISSSIKSNILDPSSFDISKIEHCFWIEGVKWWFAEENKAEPSWRSGIWQLWRASSAEEGFRYPLCFLQLFHSNAIWMSVSTRLVKDLPVPSSRRICSCRETDMKWSSVISVKFLKLNQFSRGFQ